MEDLFTLIGYCTSYSLLLVVRSFFSALVILLFQSLTWAQNYNALNGTPYIGSLGVHNNPASIVNSPLKWDLSILGLQEKHTTNVIQVYNYSLISSPANSEYLVSPGKYSRYANLNLNLNLLNARIALNRRSGIAFGINLKSYTDVKSSSYNFIDTLKNFLDFFDLNSDIGEARMNMASSSWVEAYASYGRTVMETVGGRLNAGLSVKINRGLAGAYTKLGNSSFTSDARPGSLEYLLTRAAIDVGYSATIDQLDKKQAGSNSKNFFSSSKTGGSIDIGVEYIIKTQGISTDDDGQEYFDYDWKFGASILDIGATRYDYGNYSLQARTLRDDLTDMKLDSAFSDKFNNAGDLRDSIASLYTDAHSLTGSFKINNPTRLVLNADKYLGKSFSVNVDFSLGLMSSSLSSKPAVKDLNLLTITPRWERRKAGVYLPVYYNNKNQVWVGGAARVGPVLFGVHNWANVFAKNKIQRGGLYLAIILKPSHFTGGAKPDKRLDCPPL